ncbi:MAG: hypothetical protein WAS49_09595 [Candidatus Dechloromonas phosphoritropha]|nr:hypothetical protein [Candidatus Dechloromonas phosphoritropha]MBP8789666.1 hypothetical protein [Azonexus sp.]MBP9229811.1 hypothetical protein [Azonexus sp.]
MGPFSGLLTGRPRHSRHPASWQSYTTPVVVWRFEADNDTALTRIQGDFRRAINAVWPRVEVPF